MSGTKSAKDILKRLNKNRDEEDKIKLASEQPEDYFKKTFISTGSPIIDHYLGGGVPRGAFGEIVADGGTGKSSVACLLIKNEFEVTGKKGVYFDAEGTLSESYMERMGVTKDMIYHIKGRNLEGMLNDAEALSQADDVGVIILDSIHIFVATAVEAKGADENSMAVEARKFTQRMPIVEGNCIKRDIALVGLNSFKTDPGKMGDNRVLPRGKWQYIMMQWFLDLTKKKLILDKNKNKVGHELHARIKKTKFNSFDPTFAIPVNFYYEGGFNKYDEYVTVFVQENIIERAGAWFRFADHNGEEVSLQGKDTVIEYVKENEECFNALMERYEQQ